MIAVVTGSSGFIGSHLVDALVAAGATARVLVREGHEPARSRRRSGVGYFAVDLLNANSVANCDVWAGASHVFHVAGVTKRTTLAQFRVGNVTPTQNIVAALTREAPLARLILVSSQAAGGPASSAECPMSETRPPHPVEPYGQSKLEAEQVVMSEGGSLGWTIMRPAVVYGPRDQDLLQVFKQATSRIGFYAAPRQNAFSTVYVDDLIRALMAAAVTPVTKQQTYYVTSRDDVTWHGLYETIAAIGARRSVHLQLPRAVLSLAGYAGDVWSQLSGRHGLVNSSKLALARPPWWLCDASAFEHDTGWTAATRLADGVRTTYDWYLDAGWLKAPAT